MAKSRAKKKQRKRALKRKKPKKKAKKTRKRVLKKKRLKKRVKKTRKKVLKRRKPKKRLKRAKKSRKRSKKAAIKKKKTRKQRKKQQKRFSPKEARKILGNVSPQYCLWVMNGAILKNLNEFARELDRMSNQVFRYHVSRERNDFSNWISEVYGDKKLAKDIKKAKTKKQAYRILKSRINMLKSIILRSKS